MGPRVSEHVSDCQNITHTNSRTLQQYAVANLTKPDNSVYLLQQRGPRQLSRYSDQAVRVSSPGRDRTGYYSFSTPSNWPGPTQWVLSLVKGTDPEAGHSLPSSSEVKNKRSHSSTPWRGTSFLSVSLLLTMTASNEIIFTNFQMYVT